MWIRSHSILFPALIAIACSGGTNDPAQINGAAGSTSVDPPHIPMARSALAHDPNPTIAATDYATFLTESNGFGLKLFQALADDNNAFLSPTSTLTALAMTYGGARGDTATQMAQAMQSSLDPDTFHAAVNQLSIDLAGRKVDPHPTEEGEKSLQLSLVQGAFAQQGYNFLDAYLDLLSVNYDSGIYLLDFMQDPMGSRDAINQWVAFHTQDKIEELLGHDDIKSTTRLVLTNTLYFYGSWLQAFDKNSTVDAPFFTLGGSEVSVPTMKGDLVLSYGEGDGFQILDLPYVGERVRMTLVVPEMGRFKEVRDALSTDWLKAARATMSPDTDVSLALPKFSFSWGTKSFADTLKKMGMVDAFADAVADFSGMDGTRNLFIQDVLHQAFLGVDEDGTEAAAATAVIVGFRATPDTISVSVDRPFVLFITDESDAMLFAGQVTDPSESM